MNVITRYGGALLAPATAGFDPDARSYIARVEAADGQPLEDGVRRAINQFVVGCKADGIWNSLKASCILAGARTLSGALVPLVGAAPTNFNFVSGDYNRKTGLVGNGSTKYLDSNRLHGAAPQSDRHCSIFVSSSHAYDAAIIATGNDVGCDVIYRDSGFSGVSGHATPSSAVVQRAPASFPTFVGIRRASNSEFTLRANGLDYLRQSTVSGGFPATTYHIYRLPPTSNFYTASRLAFYSIGESLDLALLDARVTTLVNAIGAALP